jgi:hypothetical protein
MNTQSMNTEPNQEINVMNAFFRIAAATLIGAGFATAAAAQQPGPRVVGSGENASVEYSAPSANIVGGALTQTYGSGESASVRATDVQNVQGGRVGRLVGSGENQTVIYVDPLPAPARVAQVGAAG